MLPPGTRPGSVRLQVADLARSLAYYTGIIGLRVVQRGDGAATLGPQGSDMPLVELTERPGIQPVRRRGQLGLFHFAILLPDRPALGTFLRHLMQVGEPVGSSNHQVSEALYLHDPDGLGIEVYADRPRSTWRYREGELLIETLPLDRDALLAGSGSASWNGVPPGTVMGHMHLHVGDLGRATAFYRDALGLEPTVWSYPGALFLSAGGYHHHLGVNTWAGADARQPGADDARLLEWELLVPDSGLRAAVDRLVSAGFAVQQWADGARVDDPWGTTLHLRRSA